MITGLSSCYDQIATAANEKRKLLAILIDPDKFEESKASGILDLIPKKTTHIFVGGSLVPEGRTESVVRSLKCASDLPIILFPGDQSQLTPEADALLFLSLVSGRNPEFLIEQQVRAASRLKHMDLEVIPTGYILVVGGKDCAVHRVSGTKPIAQNRMDDIVNTALAAKYLGKKLLYLEAGSGAAFPVSNSVIKAVKEATNLPLIVGGGIRSSHSLEKAYQSGADLVVVGTAFENGSFN